MSLEGQQKLFEEKYGSRTDNAFEAINMWVEDSRKVVTASARRVSYAEALSACLTDMLPSNLAHRKVVKLIESQYATKYTQEAAALIDDADVRRSVIASIAESQEQNNLVYKYLDVLTPGQRSRVRINCNLIWYNLYPEKGKKDA